MALTRRFLCDLGTKLVLSTPAWMQVPLARAAETRLGHLPAREAEASRLVVIDPGHGGKDPGCIGEGNVFEKDIVLDTAWDLNHALRRAGYQTMMTRDRDVFISLQHRVDFAERHRAALFISVHANAVAHDPHVRGASVFTFSPDPSDRLAAEIARSENSVETMSAPAFKGVSPRVSEILFGLMSRSTKVGSALAQRQMVESLARHVDMLPNPARRATFAVLQSSAIPSILVETAFLSNPQDEAALRTPQFRHALARSMKSAVDGWFESSRNAIGEM